jgi:hypothetical protein
LDLSRRIRPRKGGLLDEHWHPKKRTVVAIWVVVFLAAAVVAFVLQDDDPNTDEGSAQVRSRSPSAWLRRSSISPSGHTCTPGGASAS